MDLVLPTTHLLLCSLVPKRPRTETNSGTTYSEIIHIFCFITWYKFTCLSPSLEYQEHIASFALSLLTSYICISIPYDENDIIFGVSTRESYSLPLGL